jgi:hypothetical protein
MSKKEVTKVKSVFDKRWIVEQAIDVCSQYEKGILTLRALHYQLVSRGMTNDLSHYKKVVTSMIDARWEGLIDFDQFSDLDRKMEGKTKYDFTSVDDEVDNSMNTIKYWMRTYNKNRWENQKYYPEVFIEKKALQGVFMDICEEYDVSLGACKGYPSLTFLYEASERFKVAKRRGFEPIILYFGDYDPSGEDIPRSIKENLSRFGVEVEVRRISLMEEQVLEWNLPPAPAKETDTRTANWGGLGQVELDAVKPEKLISMCRDAIEDVFDRDLYEELLEEQATEKAEYKEKMKEELSSYFEE